MKVNALKNSRGRKKNSNKFQRLSAMQKTLNNEIMITWLLVDIRVWVWYLTWKFIECFSGRALSYQSVEWINEWVSGVSEWTSIRCELKFQFIQLTTVWQRMAACIRKCDVYAPNVQACMHVYTLQIEYFKLSINQPHSSHRINVDRLSILDMMLGHSTHFRHNVFKRSMFSFWLFFL